MLREYFSGLEFQVYKVPANASVGATSEQLYYIARTGAHVAIWPSAQCDVVRCGATLEALSLTYHFPRWLHVRRGEM